MIKIAILENFVHLKQRIPGLELQQFNLITLSN